MKTLAELAQDLGSGRTTSRALTEACLARIDDASGEGVRAFLSVDRDGALATADYMDGLRARGAAPSPYAGIPISVKDLFDVAGEVTRAGSTVLADAAPAERDAPAIARVRAAGFVIMGRTNMTEFAYSGVGINPHYDTPANPYDRETRRIPGGSSAGAAVSVTDGMAAVALGTDTGGSCRIPAALNGIVGYKPSAWRVPLEGAYPLSPSLDSVGPLGSSVACCAAVDAIMSTDWAGEVPERSPRGLRLGVLQTLVMGDLDDTVAGVFEASLSALSDAGAVLEDVDIGVLAELPGLNVKGGLSAAEAFAFHREQLEAHEADYDQRVAKRIRSGAEQSAAEFLDILAARDRIIEHAHRITRHYDALIMPSCAIVAPPIAAFGDDDDYLRLNFLLLRNTSVGNFLDRCAISVPAHSPGAAPVGVMLMGENGADHDLFSQARAVETVLDARRKA
ncbi:MAG: amidase [Hyphomicrobiales bacterium]